MMTYPDKGFLDTSIHTYSSGYISVGAQAREGIIALDDR